MPRVQAMILTPTDNYDQDTQVRNNGFHHLMPHLRLGRISHEEFTRIKRETPIDYDVDVIEVVKEVSPENYTRAGDKEKEGASPKQKAAKVGVRGKRAEVGKEAPLQQAEKKKAEEKKVTKAKARKKKATDGS